MNQCCHITGTVYLLKKEKAAIAILNDNLGHCIKSKQGTTTQFVNRSQSTVATATPLRSVP